MNYGAAVGVGSVCAAVGVMSGNGGGTIVGAGVGVGRLVGVLTSIGDAGG
jgi:hypothetical protein